MTPALRSILLTTRRQLVANPGGPFTTTDNWTPAAATCTLAVVSGELELTNTGAASGVADSDTFATVPGRGYVIAYSLRRGTSSSATLAARDAAGNLPGGVTTTSATLVVGTLAFVARATATFLRFSSNQAVLGRTAYIASIQVR